MIQNLIGQMVTGVVASSLFASIPLTLFSKLPFIIRNMSSDSIVSECGRKWEETWEIIIIFDYKVLMKASLLKSTVTRTFIWTHNGYMCPYNLLRFCRPTGLCLLQGE